MKTNQPKNFFFGIIVLMLFSFQSYSQIQELTWHSLIEQDGIEVFYAIGNCANTQKLFVKVKNTNNVNAQTDFILVTNDSVEEPTEHNLIITLEGDSEFVVDCENSSFTETFIIEINAGYQYFTCEVNNLNINLQ